MQVATKVYEQLYHYTTWEGLCGILDTKSLWATHCRYLNDISEISLFKSKLIEFLRPYLAKKIRSLSSLGNRELDAIARPYVEAMYNAPEYEFYIVSFCGEHKYEHENKNGLLSQWRGYGKDGGFALEFNAHKLKEILQLEHDRFNMYSILSQVVYDDDYNKIDSELSSPMHDVAEYIMEAIELNMTQVKSPPIAFSQHAQNAFPNLLRCASTYKHHGFKEENEARIVAWPLQGEIQGKQTKERKLRKKNREHVPYIELFSAPDISLPIERIIVGPHIKKEARAHALRLLLKNKLKYKNVDVAVSDIPYIY